MGSLLVAGGPVVAVFCPDDTTPSEELLGGAGVCSGGGTDARVWLASSGHVPVVCGLSKLVTCLPLLRKEKTDGQTLSGGSLST